MCGDIWFRIHKELKIQQLTNKNIPTYENNHICINIIYRYV